MVKYSGEYEYITLENGVKMKTVPLFDPQFYRGISGEVVSIPDKIRFDGHTISKIKKRIPGKKLPSFFLTRVQWLKFLSSNVEVPLEMEIGDKVYFQFNQNIDCLENGRFVEEDGDIYFFIPYNECICVVRGEQVIPLNGYILVEPIPMTQEDKIIQGVELVLMEEYVTQKGIVKYTGAPAQAYLDNVNLKDNDDIKAGMTVYFAFNDNVPIEYDLFQEINKGKPIMYMHRQAVLSHE